MWNYSPATAEITTSFRSKFASVGKETKSLKNRILYGLLLNHLELGNASLAGKGKSGNRNPKSKQIFPTDFGGDMGRFPKDTVGDLFVYHVCHTTCLVMLHRGKLRAHASDLRWNYVEVNWSAKNIRSLFVEASTTSLVRERSCITFAKPGQLRNLEVSSCKRCSAESLHLSVVKERMKLMHEHPENHLQFIAQNEHLCSSFQVSSQSYLSISSQSNQIGKSLHLSLHPTGRHWAYCICSPSLQVSPASKLATVFLNGKNDRSIPKWPSNNSFESSPPKQTQTSKSVLKTFSILFCWPRRLSVSALNLMVPMFYVMAM